MFCICRIKNDVLVLCLIFYSVSSNILDYRNLDPRTVIVNVNFSLADANENDVQFRVFAIGGKTETTGIYDKHNISSFNLNLHVPTRFVVHGWLSSEVVSFWYRDLKREYSKKGSHNIVYVDWSRIAGNEYNISVANTKRIGHYIADFIIDAKVKPHLVHLIGFSLGAHVVGFAGRRYQELTGSQLNRITLLDAAYAFFKDTEPENRAADTDAKFVDAVITDADHYGMSLGLGQVNFIANRGSMQPGCPSLKEDDNCSHQRAPIYYVESVNKYSTAVSTESRNSTIRVIFGENTSHHNRGYFTFNTRSKAPFLMEDANETCSII